MKKRDVLREAMNMISDSIIAEAVEYRGDADAHNSEISEHNEPLVTEGVSEKITTGKNPAFYLIPAAAACAALILTVNHFTNPKNAGIPQIDNSKVNEVTTAVLTSESITAPLNSEFFTENSSVPENTVSAQITSVTENISSHSVTDRNENTESLYIYSDSIKSESSYEYSSLRPEITLISPVTSEIPADTYLPSENGNPEKPVSVTTHVTDNETGHPVAPFPSAEPVESSKPTQLPCDPSIDDPPEENKKPGQNPGGSYKPDAPYVTEYKYAEYNNRRYKFMSRELILDENVGPEIEAGFIKENETNTSCFIKAYLFKSQNIINEIILLKSEDPGYYYLYYITEDTDGNITTQRISPPL